MSGNPYERGYPQGDLLGGDARAVIEAEFEEITTVKQPRPSTQSMKAIFQWIKHRVQRR